MAGLHGSCATDRPPFRPSPPLVVGLVGGIASGKSTVAAMFADRGLRHLDADQVAREVSGEPEVLAEVAERLGPRFVRDGALDRAGLAAAVFADPAARRALEAIVHPRVRARLEAGIAAATAAGDSVLLDVPLLFEAGLFQRCDTVVFVATSDETRATRARARGWADGELARREANQLPLAEKQARAEHVIDNDGTLSATRCAVDALLQRLAATSPRRP
ncbi:MAG: dephospho-CoA kinase [Planctomycetes bacterium]|nr:dephospho-CoA kinase [Planctomycetota bacterium]